MKNFLFLILITLISGELKAQVIGHQSYTSYYDAAIGQPDSTFWVLTKAMGNCKTKLARINVFVADPKVPDTKFNVFYEGSGYDQGHQFDADDASCDTTDEKECWYFTNMVPQCPNLNRITWRALENYTRQLAEKYDVNVTCGVTGSIGKLVGIEKKKTSTGIVLVKHPSNINIPEFCWKRLAYNGEVEYYVMPNRDTVKNQKFDYYRK